MEIAPDARCLKGFNQPKEEKYIVCVSCGGEIYSGERVYQWNTDGCDICEDCFLMRVRRITPTLLADTFGMRHEEFLG